MNQDDSLGSSRRVTEGGEPSLSLPIRVHVRNLYAYIGVISLQRMAQHHLAEHSDDDDAIWEEEVTFENVR